MPQSEAFDAEAWAKRMVGRVNDANHVLYIERHDSEDHFHQLWIEEPHDDRTCDMEVGHIRSWIADALRAAHALGRSEACQKAEGLANEMEGLYETANSAGGVAQGEGMWNGDDEKSLTRAREALDSWRAYLKSTTPPTEHRPQTPEEAERIEDRLCGDEAAEELAANPECPRPLKEGGQGE